MKKPTNVLITGASRGIGLGLTDVALSHGCRVMAVSRSSASDGLTSLASRHGTMLTVCAADVSQASGIASVVRRVRETPYFEGALDVLINNAGVLKTSADSDDFAESFRLNATVPFMMFQALLPHLHAPARVAQISTLMSSIQDNSSGGHYAYRSSKAALNMITKSLSIDHPQIAFALIHPGWVKTEMGGPNAPVSVEESTAGIWRVIEAMSLQTSGQFVDYLGRELPW